VDLNNIIDNIWEIDERIIILTVFVLLSKVYNYNPT